MYSVLSGAKSDGGDKIVFLDVDGVLHSYFATVESQLFRRSSPPAPLVNLFHVKFSHIPIETSRFRSYGSVQSGQLYYTEGSFHP